jgi:muramoyltetrapeptide carboxypeptidase LdcA involved in peptidoglycan recycling
LGQRETSLIESTLAQLKDPKAIGQFFSLIVGKFQQEKSTTDQLIVLAWLKTLIKLHWVQIVQRASKSDMTALSQI